MIYSKKYSKYDFCFLKEITELIVIQLTELNDGLAKGINPGNVAQCASKLCQSKFAFYLIGNDKLIAHAEQIIKILKTKSNSEVDPFLIDPFYKVCNQAIRNLSARIKYYENYLVIASKKTD